MDDSARRSTRSWIFISSVISALVLIDQITKYIARNYLVQEHHYLGGLLQLHLAENTGAFLSLGASWNPTVRFLFFSAGVSVFLLTVVWQLRKLRPRTEEWGLILLLAGGIGNLIDRVYKNSVTDFLFVDLGFVHTGIFNIADMVIVASVALLLIPQRWATRESSAPVA